MKPTDALFDSIYPKDGMIVVGLVAQVGTNLDDLCAAIRTRLENKNYEVDIISLSRFLEASGIATKEKQGQGTKLRKSVQCQQALALCAITHIWRQHCKEQPRTHKAYIIRSLKRPEEVESLRIVYGEAFLAVGVHTPKNKRVHYLKDVKGDEAADETIDCDENATDYYGQRTRDTFELCDFFIKGVDPEYTGLDRALKLWFGSVFTTPSIDEYAMSMAYAASLRSADLSRQVGASVVNSSREVVAVGANEVPRFGGGQPWPEDRPDLRDFAERKRDPNVQERDHLISDLLHYLTDHLSGEQTQKPLELTDDKVRRLVKKSGLLDITEFGRTVHAEMACLMSCLRNHTDIRDGTLYTTTFPCHNCLRHILAAGIKEVVYVEPYPKSRAQSLFDSSCSFWDDSYDKDSGEPVASQEGLAVKPFIGVGPRRYHDLFSMKTISGRRIERKNEQSGMAKIETTKNLQDLKWPSSQFGIRPREAKAVQQLVTLWSSELEADFPLIAEILPLLKTEDVPQVKPDPYWKLHLDQEYSKAEQLVLPTKKPKTSADTIRKPRKSTVPRKTNSTVKINPNRAIMNVEKGGINDDKSA